MEKMILADNTEIEIQEGASLDSITTKVADYAGLSTLAGKLTKENLSKVKFSSDNVVSAEYENMILAEPNFRITQKSGGVEVSFGLQELTHEEQQQENVQTALTYLTDEQALTVKDLYTDWEADPIGYEYSVENPLDLRRNYNSGLWRLKKNHAKQADWYPGADPTLWEQIVEGHEGTLEDPIPVPDSVTTSGFTYIYGKYYSENGQIYLCERSGVPNPEGMYGQEVTLFFLPSSLINQYFKTV